MSLFVESVREGEGWGAGADGFAESTFASMPSIPTKLTINLSQVT